jgi:hypothetical protein
MLSLTTLRVNRALGCPAQVLGSHLRCSPRVLRLPLPSFSTSVSVPKRPRNSHDQVRSGQGRRCRRAQLLDRTRRLSLDRPDHPHCIERAAGSVQLFVSIAFVLVNSMRESTHFDRIQRIRTSRWTNGWTTWHPAKRRLDPLRRAWTGRRAAVR